LAGTSNGHNYVAPRRVTVSARSLHLWREAVDTPSNGPSSAPGPTPSWRPSITRQPVVPIRFAHDLPLEFAVELGAAGLALAIALYGWRTRSCGSAGVTGRVVAGARGGGVLAANLIDWPWHLAGSEAIWALALGGCIRPAGERGPAPAPTINRSARPRIFSSSETSTGKRISNEGNDAHYSDRTLIAGSIVLITLRHFQQQVELPARSATRLHALIIFLLYLHSVI